MIIIHPKTIAERPRLLLLYLFFIIVIILFIDETSILLLSIIIVRLIRCQIAISVRKVVEMVAKLSHARTTKHTKDSSLVLIKLYNI